MFERFCISLHTIFTHFIKVFSIIYKDWFSSHSYITKVLSMWHKDFVLGSIILVFYTVYTILVILFKMFCIIVFLKIK